MSAGRALRAHWRVMARPYVPYVIPPRHLPGANGALCGATDGTVESLGSLNCVECIQRWLAAQAPAPVACPRCNDTGWWVSDNGYGGDNPEQPCNECPAGETVRS